MSAWPLDWQIFARRYRSAVSSMVGGLYGEVDANHHAGVLRSYVAELEAHGWTVSPPPVLTIEPFDQVDPLGVEQALALYDEIEYVAPHVKITLRVGDRHATVIERPVPAAIFSAIAYMEKRLGVVYL